jgi:hypothetical protein
MTSAANTQAYGTPGQSSPWGPGPTWHDHPWYPGSFGALHNLPRPLAIALTVLGFILWWPVGLAILFFMIGSGRMGCRTYRRERNNAGAPWQGGAPWSGWKNWCVGERPAPTSGNHAFDEYRTDTIRRLEEEQKEFAAFLERLRFAKDKAEFDQFMTERRQPPASSDSAVRPTD